LFDRRSPFSTTTVSLSVIYDPFVIYHLPF
jgi:hypothetical protein